MLAPALMLALSLAQTAAPSVAAPPFNVVNVPPNVAQFCAEHLATELTNRGLRVITAAEINALIGMEKQKQLLGCDEAASQSCMAELAAALGTEAVVLGQLGKLGQSFSINLKIIRSDNGVQLSNYLGTAQNEEGLIPELSKAADKLARESLRALRPGSTPEVAADAPFVRETKAPEPAANRSWPLIPTIAAGAFGVASGVTFGLALNTKSKVESANVASRGDAIQLVETGQGFQTAALVCGGLAVAALGTAAVMYLLSGEESAPSVTLAPSPNGVALVGGFP